MRTTAFYSSFRQVGGSFKLHVKDNEKYYALVNGRSTSAPSKLEELAENLVYLAQVFPVINSFCEKNYQEVSPLLHGGSLPFIVSVSVSRWMFFAVRVDVYLSVIKISISAFR